MFSEPPPRTQMEQEEIAELFKNHRYFGYYRHSPLEFPRVTDSKPCDLRIGDVMGRVYALQADERIRNNSWCAYHKEHRVGGFRNIRLRDGGPGNDGTYRFESHVVGQEMDEQQSNLTVILFAHYYLNEPPQGNNLNVEYKNTQSGLVRCTKVTQIAGMEHHFLRSDAARWVLSGILNQLQYGNEVSLPDKDIGRLTQSILLTKQTNKAAAVYETQNAILYALGVLDVLYGQSGLFVTRTEDEDHRQGHATYVYPTPSEISIGIGRQSSHPLEFNVGTPLCARVQNLFKSQGDLIALKRKIDALSSEVHTLPLKDRLDVVESFRPPSASQGRL